MNPQAPTPTLADDQPVTQTARRVGPPLALGAVVVMAGLLVWLALAPTAIAGDLADAPFTVPATLVVPPDQDGCLRVVEGDGTVREHCLDQLARGENDFRFVEAYFDDQDRLLVGEGPNLMHLDPVTGEVLGTVEVSDDGFSEHEEDDSPREAPKDEPIEVPEEGPARAFEVYARGDRVVRADFSDEDGAGTEEVLLDLHAPPGYQLNDAVLSPDEAWVVALTPANEVIVAPADGSAAPYVWTELEDGWVDLWRGVRWDD